MIFFAMMHRILTYDGVRGHGAAGAAASVLYGAAEPTVKSVDVGNGAFRLVGECYPFGPQRRILLTQDSHNSVNGIGEFAKRAGTTVTRLPVITPSLRIDRTAATESLAGAGSASPGLFAFPGQSTFSGIRHLLELVSQARAAGWDVRRETGSDVGALRASFGIASDFSDAWRLDGFLRRFIDATIESMGTDPGRPRRSPSRETRRGPPPWKLSS
ncbi:MAG: hypothetical protein ACKOYJ_08360 [Planctomycetia bacterium]